MESSTDCEPIFVAQYLRMSTEHQRYSLAQQTSQLASYASERGYEISRTYCDAGKSGLSIAGRPEMRRLIADVVSGSAQFTKILVLDVSRWGRFQDPDQAAHWEFLCREAGIPVEYCAEPFNNWTGAAAAIVKSIKRIMAAEYSRELSEKIKYAQLAQARLGFKQGGIAPYGVRRRVFDESGTPGPILQRGESKALSSDRVKYVPGPAKELRVIRQVFHQFVDDGLSVAEITRRLRARPTAGPPWTYSRARQLLRSELVLGVYTYNRTSHRLKGCLQHNPSKDWVRTSFADPIVDRKTFLAAGRRFRRHYPANAPEEDLLAALREVLATEGKLTTRTINSSPISGSASLYSNRFGSLKEAYKRIGYPGSKRWRMGPLELSNSELLARLWDTQSRYGRLSRKTIDADSELPSSTTVARRFGGFKAAYAALRSVRDHPDE